jgi:hypothetical protein
MVTPPKFRKVQEGMFDRCTIYLFQTIIILIGIVFVLLLLVKIL